MGPSMQYKHSYFVIFVPMFIIAICLCLSVYACACAYTQYGMLPIRVGTNLRRGEGWMGRVLLIPPTPDALRFCTPHGGYALD